MFYLELGIIPLREIIKQRKLNFLHYILAQDEDSIMFKVFEKQYQERHKKDWVSSILMDLEELKLDVTFVQIQNTSKMRWRNMIRKSIEENTFRKLENMKNLHSKVKDLKHTRLKMQEYFLSNGIENVTKQDTQLIFKMRSKVTNVKNNIKGQYETLECGACLTENETQKHVYECQQIWSKQNNINLEKPDYEKILWGNVEEKIKIARIFYENMKILDKMKEKKINPTVPGDGFISCLQYYVNTDWKYI